MTFSLLEKLFKEILFFISDLKDLNSTTFLTTRISIFFMVFCIALKNKTRPLNILFYTVVLFCILFWWIHVISPKFTAKVTDKKKIQVNSRKLKHFSIWKWKCFWKVISLEITWNYVISTFKIVFKRHF